MLSISHIFVIIFIFSAIALILAIIEWFHFSSLSTLISSFERELEKKSQEFDSFRKERSMQFQNHTVFPQQPVSIEPSRPLDDPNQIQIIRNIGGTFKDTSQISTETQTVTPLAQAKNYPDQLDQPTNPKQTSYDFVSSDNRYTVPLSDTAFNHVENLPPNQYPQQEINNSAPKQYSSQQNNRIESPPENSPGYLGQNTQPQPHTNKLKSDFITPMQKITLYLYSDTQKDADFNGLWKNLTTYLSSGNSVAVTIDFSNIHFIYPKEIEYLEKISIYIERLNGSFSITNCDDDVIALMRNHPQLYTKVSTINI